jgi:1-aminocyclopropane-1-carboxylate deaminase
MLEISPTPTVVLQSGLLDLKGIQVVVKRDELNHPLVMGNKWRKLKYNLELAQAQQKKTLVTYGGAFSNHIVATAAAAYYSGFKSIGIIRGDELNAESNPTLQTAAKLGMQLEFTGRREFADIKKNLSLPQGVKSNDLSFMYFLPEGGTNQLAVKGASEIIGEINQPFDICCTAMGTGGTFLGLLQAMGGKNTLWGFSALKGDWVQDQIKQSTEVYDIAHDNYLLFHDNLFGGYGRFDRKLIQFILDFRQEYNILLDPIYTGKMFFRVWEMMKNDQIAKGTTILMIHTGGLQGIKGFNFRFGQQLPES